MTWAKLDDAMGEHRKIKRALKRSRAAIALHFLSILYCARYLTDGFVEREWLEDVCEDARMKPAEREKATATLVEQRLWHVVDGGWEINDYLVHNPTKADVEARRAARAEAGRSGGLRSGQSRREANTSSKNEANTSAVASTPSNPTPTPTPTPVPITTPSGSPNAYSGDEAERTKSLHLDEDDHRFADRVCGILQRGIDSLTSEEPRKLPTPAGVAAVLLRCPIDRDAALAAAVTTRSICQSQNRAPNIIALFEQQIRKRQEEAA